jgi:hypothetical protein
MDIDFVFGGSIEDSLVRPELMGPKTLEDKPVVYFEHSNKN